MMGGLFCAHPHGDESLGNVSNPNRSGAAFSLTTTQQKIVAEIAEMIIPRTDTAGEASPGAKDVGVPAFIEMMLKDCYNQPEHLSFTEGLASMEQVKFLELNEAEGRGYSNFWSNKLKKK